MRIEDVHDDRAAEEMTERQPTETMVDDPRTDEHDMRTDERDSHTDERDSHIDEHDSRTDERAPAGESAASAQEAPLELFGHDDVNRFRDEWREVQARFVDDPQAAVQGADQLVAEVMGSLTTTFTNHKQELEGQWRQGSEAQTEDLRQALRRYRTFFNQLLDA